MGLGYATSNRGGCHLNGGYVALIETVGVLFSVDTQTPKEKAELGVFFQNMIEAASASASACLLQWRLFPAFFPHLAPHTR